MKVKYTPGVCEFIHLTRHRIYEITDTVIKKDGGIICYIIKDDRGEVYYFPPNSKDFELISEIKVSVTWKYTNPRQYKERDYTFSSQEHYDTWYAKMISDESLRKIIKLETI